MSIPDTQQQTPFKVLLIGDSGTDEYKIGTIDRLSPEAPVPVVKLLETQTVPGMASNVNLNLKNLGLDTYFIHNSEQIVKTRFIDQRSGQHIMRLDVEPEIVPWSKNSIESIDSFDAIVISDYCKGFLTYENISHIISSTSSPIFIDTKKTDLKRISAKHVFIKVNDSESKLAISHPDNLIITRGGDGAWYNDTDYPTRKSNVLDVCGCGDTFLAALCAQYLSTKDIEKAIIFANIAAGITVQHLGNYAPSYDEIRIAGY